MAKSLPEIADYFRHYVESGQRTVMKHPEHVAMLAIVEELMAMRTAFLVENCDPVVKGEVKELITKRWSETDRVLETPT